MKRRNFLRAATALTVPAFVPLTGVRANISPLASLIDPDSDRILVILQLFGGNDGLNTIFSLDQMKGYAKVRKEFHVRAEQTLKLNDSLGIHPRLAGMKNMFDDGKLQIIQSVGYPNPNQSHFRSAEIWSTASSSEEKKNTGWVGRYLDSVHPNYPDGYPSGSNPDPLAVTIGNNASATCEGESLNFSSTVNDPKNVNLLKADIAGGMPDDNYGSELDFLRTSIRQTNDYNKVIQTAYSKGSNKVSYADQYGRTVGIAAQLKKVARLISGGLRTKVYTVYMSGFDTHALQTGSNFTNGKHADLLAEVNTAISAFQKDLNALNLEKRVLGMTFSEFGRRIRTNDSRGTDHGAAAPMFLFGSCVNAGIIGDNVKLDGDIDQGDTVPMQFDFRDVYGSILVDWFKVPGFSVRSLLHEKFRYMPLASDCNQDSYAGPSEPDEDSGWSVGKPYVEGDKLRIPIGSPGDQRLRYSMFDGRGRLVLANEIGVSGQSDYTLFKRPNRLPNGKYQLRLAVDTGSVVTREVEFK